MDLLRKKKVWIGLAIATLIMIVSIDLAALVFVGSCIGIWYFKKKKPNKNHSFIAICLAVISFFVVGIGGSNAESDSGVATVEESSSESAESPNEEELAAIEESKQKEEEDKAKAESEAKEEEERKKAESESIAKKEEEEKKLAEEKAEMQQKVEETQSSAPSIPAGEAYVEVNDNVPLFTNEDISSTEAWEDYGPLDDLGRVTIANAVLGVELMPAEERGDISGVEPTGWKQEKFSVVSGGWLYNRSHLIGHQLTGEDDNAENLMTGTRYFNTEGMLPFENFVANYIEETENHVRYRITPHFEGDNLLASGIYMEGFSIEDNGEGLSFHIYVPNIQPEVEINYATGESKFDEPVVEEPVKKEPVKKEAPKKSVVEETPAPAPSGGDVSSVDTNGNGKVTIQEAKDAGFSMPLYSDHWLYKYMDDRDNDGMVGE